MEEFVLSKSLEQDLTIEDWKDYGFEIEGTVLKAYHGDESEVDIPDFVTEIGKEAFKRNKDLTCVRIPESVVIIRKDAFTSCSNLCEVTLPSSLKKMEGGAFSFCPQLKKINMQTINFKTGMSCFQGSLKNVAFKIPEGTKIIPDSLFFSSLIRSVTIPQSVTEIQDSSFYSCKNLAEVHYEGSLADWCAITFGRTDSNPLLFAKDFYIQGQLLKDRVVIPEDITKISPNAFSGFCGMRSLTLSPNMEIVDISSFRDCKTLEEVEIPYGVKVIGDYAFYNCNKLKKVSIPDSILAIGVSAFGGCSSLLALDIPESVKAVGTEMVGGTVHLQRLSLSFSGTVLDYATSKDMGSYPLGYFFNTHGSLDNKTEVNQEYWNVLKNKKDTLYNIVFPDALKEVTVTGGAIPYGAFNKCYFLERIQLNDGVDRIGEYAFSGCKGLRELVIPEGVEEIKPYTFSDCTQLERVVFPSTLKRIDSYAFKKCESLKEIMIPASVQVIDKKAFYMCDGVEHIIVEKGNKVYHSAGECLIKTETRTLVKASNHCRIPNDGSVTTIGESAFENNEKLEYIELPDTVSVIEDYAFELCQNLKTIRFLGSRLKWWFSVSTGFMWKDYCYKLEVVCGK